MLTAQLGRELQAQCLELIKVQGVVLAAAAGGPGLQLSSEQLLNGAVAAAPAVLPGLVCLLFSAALTRQAFQIRLWASHTVDFVL